MRPLTLRDNISYEQTKTCPLHPQTTRIHRLGRRCKWCMLKGSVTARADSHEKRLHTSSALKFMVERHAANSRPRSKAGPVDDRHKTATPRTTIHPSRPSSPHKASHQWGTKLDAPLTCQSVSFISLQANRLESVLGESCKEHYVY